MLKLTHLYVIEFEDIITTISLRICEDIDTLSLFGVWFMEILGIAQALEAFFILLFYVHELTWAEQISLA